MLGQDFYARDTVEVARELLGKVLVRKVRGTERWGRLVEVEAYLGPDDACAHSYRGHRSARNEVMYGSAGHAYVYFTYGMHHCLNFVTREPGLPQAVLIRALEPAAGVDRCSGPGLLCRSLEIDRELNGAALRPPTLFVIDDGRRPDRIYATPRIGVGSGEWADKPLRFCVDSPALSRPIPKLLKRLDGPGV